MAHTSAGVDVVDAKGRTGQLLDQIGLLVGAARGGDRADRFGPVFFLQAPQLTRRVGDGLLPAHFAPGIADRTADHRRGNTVGMRGIAPGEAALDAGMAMIGATIEIGHHADHLLALQLGIERAPHAAIGAGGCDAALRLTHLDDGFFHQRRCGAGRDTGAAGHAFGRHEILAARCRDAAVESALGGGQGVGALDVGTGPHAARADDALRRIVGEIGVRGIRRLLQMVLAVGVADLAKADATGLVLQFAVAVGGTSQAVERVIGDIQLHDAATQAEQGIILGGDLHALLRQRGT